VNVHPAIVYPLVLQAPSFSAFTAMNWSVALLCTTLLAMMVIRRPARLGRFAVTSAGALNLIMQWPLALYSSQIESSLVNAWFFALSAHVPTMCLIVWVILNRKLEPTQTQDRVVLLSDLTAPTVAMFGLLGAFLLFVPYYCTALFALLFDPSNTLLAREVTIKLAGSTIATSSYGAVANAAAPAVAGVSVVLALRALKDRNLVLLLACLMLVGVSFAAVMVAGSKGLLVSLFVVVAYCAVGASRTIFAKLALLMLSAILLVVLLTSFELLRERGGRLIPYDFKSCVIELGAGEVGREMLRSMASGGLTMTSDQVEAVLAQLDNDGAPLPTQVAPQVRPATVERASTYLEALAYRAFVIPIQGAAWHHLYVQEHGSPGIGTLPLALRLLGYSVDATTLVYREYGAVYSGGDVTSTSTTPTSYFFAYPAYFGWVGLAAATALTLAVDLAAALAMRRTNRVFFAMGAGLLAVIAYNGLTSDLWTVMVSHGGGVALVLIIITGSLSRRGPTVRS
jgi:hypothetical protein